MSNTLKITPDVQEAINRKIAKCVEEIGIANNGIPSYEQLVYAHKYVMDRFTYVSDNKKFFNPQTGEGYNDYFDTQAFEKLMYYGRLEDDCDGGGMAMLEFLIKVLQVDTRRLYRGSCRTETGEGHFVDFAKTDDNQVYQVEIRGKVASIKYYKDMGYEYWHYSRMDRIEAGWVDAKRFIADSIYDTPNNLASDKPEFSIAKALRIDKSKQLAKEWLTAISGVGLVVSNNAPAIASTLEANKENLSTFLNLQTVGILMFISSMVGVYFRTVTNKDVDSKKSYDG